MNDDEFKAQVRELRAMRNQQPDPFLTMIAEDGTLGATVTLAVGGLLVTGEVITAEAFIDAYFDQVEEALQRQVPDHDSDPEVWANIRSGAKGILGAATRPDGLPDDPDEITDEHRLELAKVEPLFIHLRHAQFFAGPEGPVSQSKTLWRGRLASVDGWIPGLMSSRDA